MKINEVDQIKETAGDSEILGRATRAIYEKMRAAGMPDNGARHKIAVLLRREAAAMDYHK